MAYAAATERIKLGTGVLPIYSRTPAATAQQTATIDEYSGGRMVLGLGVSHAVTVENWYGTKIEHPVTAMREYVEVLRAMFEGRGPAREHVLPDPVPIHGVQAKGGPTDLRGRAVPEHAAACRRGRGRRDAVALQPQTTCATSSCPRSGPGVSSAGKDMDGFDVVAAVPAAVTDDREAAYETMRADLVTYWSLPFYRAMIERSGFGADIAAFDAGMRRATSRRRSARSRIGSWAR